MHTQVSYPAIKFQKENSVRSTCDRRMLEKDTEPKTQTHTGGDRCLVSLSQAYQS